MSPDATHDLAEFASLDPRPDIRLIATDMDGTLLGDDRQLHAEFWPLIDQLHQRGVTFCPASGRQYYSLRRQFGPVAEEMVFIAENGTYVVDGSDGAEISSDCIDVAAAHTMIERVRTVPGAYPVLCGKRSAYIDESRPDFVAEVQPYYAALEQVDDLLRIADDEILKVAVFDFASSERSAAPALSDFAHSHQVVVSGAHWVDVMSLTANKGAAVRQIQDRHGIADTQTMVFGDFLNDLEMMSTGTYSFAMANAHPLLRERASWTAPTNSANGVVRTIRAVMGLD